MTGNALADPATQSSHDARNADFQSRFTGWTPSLESLPRLHRLSQQDACRSESLGISARSAQRARNPFLFWAIFFCAQPRLRRRRCAAISRGSSPTSSMPMPHAGAAAGGGAGGGGGGGGSEQSGRSQSALQSDASMKVIRRSASRSRRSPHCSLSTPPWASPPAATPARIQSTSSWSMLPSSFRSQISSHGGRLATASKSIDVFRRRRRRRRPGPDWAEQPRCRRDRSRRRRRCRDPRSCAGSCSRGRRRDRRRSAPRRSRAAGRSDRSASNASRGRGSGPPRTPSPGSRCACPGGSAPGTAASAARPALVSASEPIDVTSSSEPSATVFT